MSATEVVREDPLQTSADLWKRVVSKVSTVPLLNAPGRTSTLDAPLLHHMAVVAKSLRFQ